MSADWKELQQLDGANFIADADAATRGWMAASRAASTTSQNPPRPWN
jgi:hypothetical protein